MALLNITGFDTAHTEGEFSVGRGGTWSFSNTVTRFGTGYSVRVNPTTTGAGNVQPAGSYTSAGVPAAINTTTPYYRFYFRYATKPASASEQICQCFNAAEMQVRLDSTGKLSFWDGTTQLGSTGTTVLAQDTWYRIEVKSVSGAWEVKINGTTEISGADAFSGATATLLSLGKRTNRNGNSVDFYYDDFALSDSAYPADGRCVLLVPNANGTYQTWSIGAGSGSHYQIVNEVPPDDDTSYLLSDLIAGDAETEAFAFSTSVTSIQAVKALVLAKRDGASNGSVQLRLRSASTNTDLTATPSVNIGSHAPLGNLRVTDPATSAAWTASGVDGCEVGLVNQGTGFASRMTFAGLYVDYVPAVIPPLAMHQYRQRGNI